MERNLNFRQNIRIGFWEHPGRTIRGAAFGAAMYTGGVYAASQGEVTGAILTGAIGTAVNVVAVADCYSTGRRIVQGRLRRRDG